MRQLRLFLVLFSAVACVFTLAARGQDDSPSLGDVARRSRVEKQQKEAQAKDAQSKDAPVQTPQAKDAQKNDGQSKDAQGNDKDRDKDKDAGVSEAQAGKEPHVITNEDISEPIGPTRSSTFGSRPSPATDEQPPSDAGKVSAEAWRSQIQAQKDAIESLKSQIDTLAASIQYAGGNCVSGCAQWNERQQQKQQQVDAMKAQLEQQENRLQDMQEAARKQGYGSSVYDP